MNIKKKLLTSTIFAVFVQSLTETDKVIIKKSSVKIVHRQVVACLGEVGHDCKEM